MSNTAYCRTPFALRIPIDRTIMIPVEIHAYGTTGDGSAILAPVNTLIMRIQPEEGISLSFQAKRPGSKLCMGTLNMSFSYGDVFGVDPPEAYQRLLLDVMTGDQTLFMRFDTLEATWKLLDPVLQKWQNNEVSLATYAAGCQSFPEADELISRLGHAWRPL